MTRAPRQADLPLEQGGVCEACGDEAPRLFKRYGVGLAVCIPCHALPSSEVAKVWLGKIRKVVER